MATKLGDDVSTFNGLEVVRSRPRTFIVEADVEDIISDVVHVYETILGTSLVGGALVNTAPQVHDGLDGALLGWPLSHISIDEGTQSTYQSQQLNNPSIDCGAITLTDNRIVYRWPVFVPTGMSTVVVHVRASRRFWELFPTISVFNTSWTQDGDPVAITPGPGGDDDFWFIVPISSTGAVKILSLDINNVIDNDDLHRIYNVRVLPQEWEQAASLPPEAVASLSGAIASPAHTTTWNTIWDTLTAAGRPLSSGLLTDAAENLAMLFERVTGSPAPGIAAASANDGHNHDGSNSKHIDMPLLSVGLGWVPVAGAGFASTEADHGDAPYLDPATTGYVDTLFSGVQWPRRASSLTVNWSAVVYDNVDNGTDTRVTVSSSPGGSGTTSTAANTTGGGWHYVAGTLAVTHATHEWLRWELRQNANKTGAKVCMTGACAWVLA